LANQFEIEIRHDLVLSNHVNDDIYEVIYDVFRDINSMSSQARINAKDIINEVMKSGGTIYTASFAIRLIIFRDIERAIQCIDNLNALLLIKKLARSN
jgi:hypothetical protein